MEVKGEEEERRLRSEEDNYLSLLNSPCSAFHKAVEAILRCLGLDSSSSTSEEVPEGTETVEETGFMARVTGMLRRRRPKPPYSSGKPGQIG